MWSIFAAAVRIELSVCEGIAYLDPCAGRNTLLSLALGVYSCVATPLREGCGLAWSSVAKLKFVKNFIRDKSYNIIPVNISGYTVVYNECTAECMPLVRVKLAQITNYCKTVFQAIITLRDTHSFSVN